MIVADTNLIAALLLPSALNGEAGRIFETDPAWVFPVLWRSEWSAVLLKLLRAPPQASIPTRQPHLDQ